MDLDQKLSPNFALREFIKSPTAIRLGIDNTPTPAIVENLRGVCFNILEPVRAHFGKPVRISSGYRCPRLNDAVGGAVTSGHLDGVASDFEVDGVPNYDVAKFVADTLTYDQVILEFYTTGQPHSGWVHASWRHGNNRMQLLTIGPRGTLKGLHP